MAWRKSTRLRIQLRDPPVPTPPPLPKKRKTGAEATRDWKQKMKESDPERWEEYMAQNKVASKAYRQSCSDEKKVRHWIRFLISFFKIQSGFAEMGRC